MAVKKNDPYGSDTTNDELLRRRAARFDNEMQADTELAEGSAGGGRIALFAIAIVAIIGAVFFGLNNPSTTPSQSTAQTTTTVPVSPPAPVPSQTTGSATSTQTSPPPASTPPAVNQPTVDSPSDTNSGSTNMAPAPSPSNGGTTQSGPPANN